MIQSLLKWLTDIIDRPVAVKTNEVYEHNGVLMSVSEDGTFLFSLKRPAHPTNPVVLSLNVFHNLKVFEEFESTKDRNMIDRLPDMNKSLNKEYLSSLSNKELNGILEHSVEQENYELSAIIRDILDNRNTKDND